MVRIVRALDRESGFTLLELMLVVLIIAILLGISIPSYMGAHNRAYDRASQSDLRNALLAAKVYQAESDTYLGFTAATASVVETGLAWTDGAGAPPGNGVVGIDPAGTTKTTVVMNADSGSGALFCIAEDTQAGEAHGRGVAATFMACLALPDW